MNDWDPARERSRARSTRPAPVTVERGCEVALADMKDAKALTAAFTGRERGVRADPVELSLLSCRKAGKARICTSGREPSGKSRLI